MVARLWQDRCGRTEPQGLRWCKPNDRFCRTVLPARPRLLRRRGEAGEEPFITAEDGRRAQIIDEAVLHSAPEGKPVAISY
jgi:hypothetical protein